jgi:Ca2+-binding RTX toxin-like protein
MIFDGVSCTFDDMADVGGKFLYGGDGNNYIVGSNLNDYIEGDPVASGSTEQGDDTIYGMAGNDYVVGGKGNDILWGDGILRPGYLNAVAAAAHSNNSLMALMMFRMVVMAMTGFGEMMLIRTDVMQNLMTMTVCRAVLSMIS